MDQFSFPHNKLLDDGAMGNRDGEERLNARRVTDRHKIEQKIHEKRRGKHRGGMSSVC